MAALREEEQARRRLAAQAQLQQAEAEEALCAMERAALQELRRHGVEAALLCAELRGADAATARRGREELRREADRRADRDAHQLAASRSAAATERAIAAEREVCAVKSWVEREVYSLATRVEAQHVAWDRAALDSRRGSPPAPGRAAAVAASASYSLSFVEADLDFTSCGVAW